MVNHGRQNGFANAPFAATFHTATRAGWLSPLWTTHLEEGTLSHVFESATAGVLSLRIVGAPSWDYGGPDR